MTQLLNEECRILITFFGLRVLVWYLKRTRLTPILHSSFATEWAYSLFNEFFAIRALMVSTEEAVKRPSSGVFIQ